MIHCSPTAVFRSSVPPAPVQTLPCLAVAMWSHTVFANIWSHSMGVVGAAPVKINLTALFSALPASCSLHGLLQFVMVSMGNWLLY